MARDVQATPPHLMMAAHSSPNVPGGQVAGPCHGPTHGSKASVYSYLHNQSGLNFAPVVHPQQWEQQQQQQLQQQLHQHQHQQWPRDAGSPPPAPPVRDASSLKGIKYGPGHEKFPSWPMSAAAEPCTPSAPRTTVGGGSHRSKSWTDHTNYPKENGIPYTRPFMKRPNPSFLQQQLKTVLERCEKMPPDESRLYLPRVDREGKLLGDNDYMVPSPPERDVISTKPHLTQADLEEYARSLSTSYRDPPLTKVELEEYAMSYQEPKSSSPHLTQADLEEYSRSYDEVLRPQHHHQPSYAQSEGYHSYVSSTDSIMATPFMDRLRRDSEAVRAEAGPQTAWCDDGDRAGRDSVVTTSSGSASSSETLKWHGSMSDVSVTSSSHTHHQSTSRQLIAHSAKVQSPQRHNSESVLFPAGSSGWQTRVQRNNNHNKLRLFPVNTYTVQPEQAQPTTPISPTSPQLTVAERIGEIERQHSRYSYLDPDKKLRVSDPTLKAIQKKALLSFYERHHSAPRNQVWRSEPLLAQPAQLTLVPAPQSPPPQPPPRPRGNQTSRRASSASDYAGNWREKMPNRVEKVVDPGNIKDGPRHQHSNSCGSLSTDLLGPLILGPTILLDDWVPERPPKKAHLRVAFPGPVLDRVPSPDIPPPSPPAVMEDEVFAFDEPLPPPPPELHPGWNQTNLHDKTKPEDAIKQNDASANQRIYENGISHKKSASNTDRISPPHKSPSSPSKSPPQSKAPMSPNNKNMNQTFARTLSMKRSDNESQANCGVPAMKLADTNWSALRYQTQKLMINGKIATSYPVHEAERMNGNAMLPSKARLQRVPNENQNGSSRSPPHLKPIQSNDPRLRASNIRDSFRSQKNRATRSPPSEQTRHSPPSQTRSDADVNGRLDYSSNNHTEGERRGPQGNHSILSTSKASYLAYRRDSHRERSLPSFEGSYKRTMSPSEVVLDTHTSTDCVRLPLTAAVVTDKLSPSHHPTHQTEIKERCIIIPTTVIDEKLSVKTCDDAFRQRVTCDTIKQFIHIEPELIVNSETVILPNEHVKEFNVVESVVTTVKGIEIQTQCDMSVLDDADKGVVIATIDAEHPVLEHEIVLVGNLATIDVASQTEKELSPSEAQATVKPTALVRQKLQEEIECEQLSLDLASQLSPSDKLQGILVPAADLKRPTDYVAGLFRLDISQRSRSSLKNTSPKSGKSPPHLCNGDAIETVTQTPLPANSAYFTTSESKAMFLTRFSTDMSQSDQLDSIRDNDELQRKKEELMARLDRKLVVLRAEHLELTEECRVNDELGATVAAQVSCLARPHEAAKYLLHVEEVGKITSLLLGLSGRLARAENALNGMPEQHSDRKILESKRDKLKDQLEEAKKLKENIDRRSVFVSNILCKYFNADEYTDYDHFINMKAKLIMDSREIVDKIKLGEEQLTALKETLSSLES